MISAKDILWSIFWLLVLIHLAWPISMFFGFLYGYISPLTTCVGLDKVTEFLLKGASLGRSCAENIKSSKTLC